MGDVIEFRRAPLTGFIPADLDEKPVLRNAYYGLSIYEQVYGEPYPVPQRSNVTILAVVRVERNGSEVELPSDCGPDIA